MFYVRVKPFCIKECRNICPDLQEESDIKMAVQEALSMMSDSFKNIEPSSRKLLEALIMENIEKTQPQSRLMAVQYANTVFPRDHIPSRYVLLLACGDL